MPKSESIGSLAGALAKAQLQMETAKKDVKNPHLGNKYADLKSCWAACRKPLGDNGLSVSQLAESLTSGTINITSILMHESGEWVSSELAIPWAVNKGINTAQAMGSAISYGRRYGLSALVGISTDDDDGNASSNNQRQAPHQQPAPKPKPAPKPVQQTPVRGTITDKQVQKLAILAGELGLDRGQKLKGCMAHAGRVLISSTELSKEEACKVIDAMETKKAVK